MRLNKLGGLVLVMVSVSELMVTPKINTCCAQKIDEGTFVVNYFNEILDVASKAKNEKECIKKVIEISEGKINFDSIAKRSCTKNYYNELKEKDPKALEYMKSMIVSTVLTLTKKYDKGCITIGKPKVIPSKRNTKVETTITAKGENYVVAWIIKKNAVVDLICENMSLVGVLKTQFYEYIKKHGVENFLGKCKNISKAR